MKVLKITFATAVVGLLLSLGLAVSAEASTRPVRCGPVTVHADGGVIKVWATSWQSAPDVHSNIPCRTLRRAARYIASHGGMPPRGWMEAGRDGATASRPGTARPGRPLAPA